MLFIEVPPRACASEPCPSSEEPRPALVGAARVLRARHPMASTTISNFDGAGPFERKSPFEADAAPSRGAASVSKNIECDPPGLSLAVEPGAILGFRAEDGRIFMTPSCVAISWILRATSDIRQALKRKRADRAAGPRFSTTMYPAATTAPCGVARDHGCANVQRTLRVVGVPLGNVLATTAAAKAGERDERTEQCDAVDSSPDGSCRTTGSSTCAGGLVGRPIGASTPATVPGCGAQMCAHCLRAQIAPAAKRRDARKGLGHLYFPPSGAVQRH